MDSDEDIESSSGDHSDAYITSSDDNSEDPLNKATKYKFKRSKLSCLKLQKNHLEPIAKVLREVVTGTTNFFSEDELCKTDFNIKVEGVGYLTFPLTDNRIQKLISVSTKALSGKGEETLLNQDIHEIPVKKLQVHIKQDRFTQMLGTIRSEIGFSDSCNLEAQLHNMLIYSPDQFLDFQQDSVTATDMIGTLVIIVPSPHIGGNLIIQHDTKEHLFVSENLASRTFKCIGFYADCKHKIEKVRQGFRVALTYKLILKSGDNTSTPCVNRNLKNAIQNYFDNCQNDIFQNKFVYMLDHSYTEHSLKWNMLKGEDNKTGTSLLAVAKSLDLVPYLALIEIQYIWSNLHKYRHHCANPIPIELDQVNCHMLHFVNSNNEKQPFKSHCSAREKEICWTKETTASFQHYSSYCEGFTGDGLTLDYWYKRGVVVLWPSSMKIELNFKLNYEKAFEELQAKIAVKGKEREVCEIVKKCSKYLCGQSKCPKKDFITLAEIALYIKDKEVSKCILSHFKWDILSYSYKYYEDLKSYSTQSAIKLAELNLQYGSIWCNDLLNKWKETQKFILNHLSDFIDVFLYFKGSKEVVHMILNEQICNISLQTMKQRTPDEINKYIEIVGEIFVSCTLIESVEFLDNVMRYVISKPLIFTNINLCELYLWLKAKKNWGWNNNIDIVGYCKPLKTYIETKFGTEIVNEANTKNDWSIKKQLNCQCKHCKEVNVFLISKTEKRHELKLPQSHREHVEYFFKSLDLPVSLTVSSRIGIEKLILLKSETLLQDRFKECAKLKWYLERIQ